LKSFGQVVSEVKKNAGSVVETSKAVMGISGEMTTVRLEPKVDIVFLHCRQQVREIISATHRSNVVITKYRVLEILLCSSVLCVLPLPTVCNKE